MNTDKILSYIGQRVAAFYASLADGDNTRQTRLKLYDKIATLLELLDEFNIEYEIIGDKKGIIINNKSYTYTIKDYALWKYCINEKFVKCAESEEDMADVELVIKIPVEQYNRILLSDKTAISEFVSKESMMYAIKTGTPLPKGHGNLKDTDKIEEILDVKTPDNMIAKALKNLIESVPTIIEADEEEE